MGSFVSARADKDAGSEGGVTGQSHAEAEEEEAHMNKEGRRDCGSEGKRKGG